MRKVAILAALTFCVLGAGCGGSDFPVQIVPFAGTYGGTYQVFVDGVETGHGDINSGNVDGAGTLHITLGTTSAGTDVAGTGVGTFFDTGDYEGQYVTGGVTYPQTTATYSSSGTSFTLHMYNVIAANVEVRVNAVIDG